MKKNLNSRILEIRLERGMERNEFGGRLGVTGRYVEMLEKGARNPSEGLILAMCFRFGVREPWLKDGKGRMFA